MSGGQLLSGIVLFGAVAGAGGLLAFAVLRRLALDPLERLLGGVLVFLAAVMAIHLVPLLLTVLSRGTVVVTTALVALAAVVLLRCTRAAPAPAPATHPPAAPRDARWALWLAGVVAVITLAAVVADVRQWLPEVFRGVDTVTFHLPNAQRWIQTGSLWQLDEYLPGQAHGSYPNHGELLFVWALLPFESDFLVRAAIVPLLGAWAIAAFAVARELGIPRSTGVLIATALVSIPIVGIATVPRAMPDIVLYAAMTIALLFLLRHLRTRATSDLLLAGLGLGIGFGTKWYGVTTAAIAIGVFALATLVRTRRPGPALAHGALLAAVTTAAGGVWLVRNLVETDNPFFPVKLAPLGITIFDAPADRIREQVGFSIADYVTKPDILFGPLLGEILDGAGAVVALALVLALLGLVLGRRDRRALALAGGALAIAAVYAITPYTALGFEDEPDLAEFNTRYVVPAVVCALLAGGAAVARIPRLRAAVNLALAATTLVALPRAYGLPAKQLVLAAAGLAVAAALVAVVARRPRRARRFATAFAAIAALLGGVAYAARTEDRFSTFRYAVDDPTLAAIERLGGAHRVGITGQWTLEGASPVWASFGPRLQNEVTYIGSHDSGFLQPHREARAFLADLQRHRYDLLVLGRGLTNPKRVVEEDWAQAAGYVPVVQSARLALLAAPWVDAEVPPGQPLASPTLAGP